MGTWAIEKAVRAARSYTLDFGYPEAPKVCLYTILNKQIYTVKAPLYFYTFGLGHIEGSQV